MLFRVSVAVGLPPPVLLIQVSMSVALPLLIIQLSMSVALSPLHLWVSGGVFVTEGPRRLSVHPQHCIWVLWALVLAVRPLAVVLAVSPLAVFL